MTISKRLFLKGSATKGFHEAVHYLVENIIFHKWTYFKNRPRSTFLLVRSLLINAQVYAAYYVLFSHVKFLIMGIDVDPVLLFSGSTFIGYWAMSHSFHQKCNYLSSLYNEALKVSATDRSNETLMLKLNFSIQLLTTDLWGHRLYSWMLSDTLLEVIHWAQETQQIDPHAYINKLNAGQVSSSEVRDLLLLRVKSLMQNAEGKARPNHLRAV